VYMWKVNTCGYVEVSIHVDMWKVSTCVYVKGEYMCICGR
jgi:hypothetical protein